MSKLQVFDPAMCCPTGVCGPQVDPALVRFAADLEWLESNGVEVERFNLSQEPTAFVSNAEVASAMRSRDDALPLLLVDGKVVSQGIYPGREVLAELAAVAAPKSIYRRSKGSHVSPRREQPGRRPVGAARAKRPWLRREPGNALPDARSHGGTRLASLQGRPGRRRSVQKRVLPHKEGPGRALTASPSGGGVAPGDRARKKEW